MTRLEPGEVLEDRYRIDRTIARGGMSTVYRCLDLRLGRAVAAKVMDGDYLDDPISRDRFTREARAMAQLRHPNILGVYDFSSAGEHIFLITELITGGTLGELLAETGPLDPATATVLLRSVLQGLVVAHDKGLVHRDIKPHNVLIDADGGIKLADFGLVRAMNNPQKTSNQIVGTVSYISPEQVDGGHITPATDVYSAGIVLFELLTGKVPYEGETSLGRALARLHNDVPAPSDLIDGIPPLFDALVASATTRNPDERFRDAQEFLDALDDVASELLLPHVAVPVPENAAAHRAAVLAPFVESPLPEATARQLAIPSAKKHRKRLPRAPLLTPPTLLLRLHPLAREPLNQQSHCLRQPRLQHLLHQLLGQDRPQPRRCNHLRRQALHQRKSRSATVLE